ncbi:hypothetical protein MPSEU_001047800 [Mayamaea pseudoterrestris]|nr:hypothetical protein MPSEU_001047800 [Mayamaea pseudoterrestris]
MSSRVPVIMKIHPHKIWPALNFPFRNRATKISNMNFYSTAMALNNIGVKLLQHHQVSAAIETLQEAIGVMKNVVDESGAAPAATALPEEGNLLRASARLTEAMAHPVDSDLVVDVLCLDLNGLAVPDRKTLSQPQSLVFRPILMDCFCANCSNVSEKPFHSSNPIMESSIILYNLGVASLLAAKLQVAKKDAEKAKCLANAARLLELAFTLISRLSAEPCKDRSVPVILFLQLGLYMTSCIAHTLREQGQFQATNTALARMSLIVEALASIGIDIFGGKSTLAASAA